MLNNGMTPQNALFIDENGDIHSIITLLKNIGSGGSKMIELQKGATHIQWRYSDEEEWKDLIAISDLKGEKGEKGIQGEAGEKGADGFGTEEQYNDIIRRLEALEATMTPPVE